MTHRLPDPYKPAAFISLIIHQSNRILMLSTGRRLACADDRIDHNSDEIDWKMSKLLNIVTVCACTQPFILLMYFWTSLIYPQIPPHGGNTKWQAIAISFSISMGAPCSEWAHVGRAGQRIGSSRHRNDAPVICVALIAHLALWASSKLTI